MSQTASKQPINVDFDVLELCADLAIHRKQNMDYWTSVPIPLDPNRAMPREGLQRMAVFLPLLLVFPAWSYLGYKWALGIFFAAALPMMAALHSAVGSRVSSHLRAAANLDQGRYAAVKYLSAKLGLASEQITWAWVMEQAVAYAKLWLKVDAQRKAERAAKAAAASAATAKASTIDHGMHSYGSGAAHVAIGSANMIAGAAANLADFPAMDILAMSAPQFNTANGLPMMNDLFDIHGNTAGTTNVDDMLAYLDETTHATSHGSVDFTTPAFDMSSYSGGHGYGFD